MSASFSFLRKEKASANRRGHLVLQTASERKLAGQRLEAVEQIHGASARIVGGRLFDDDEWLPKSHVHHDLVQRESLSDSGLCRFLRELRGNLGVRHARVRQRHRSDPTPHDQPGDTSPRSTISHTTDSPSPWRSRPDEALPRWARRRATTLLRGVWRRRAIPTARRDVERFEHACTP
jgi:hypothetical protein